MIKNIAAAFQFLTLLPVPLKTNGRNLEQSIPWFPLVGAVMGLATGFAYQGFLLLFPSAVAATLTISLYIILSRGLHLDGFMDTIDGFFSCRERERILQIMKEPTVGSFAVLGMGVWCLLLFATIPLLSPVDHIFLHMLTRFQVLLPPLFFSYPRQSGTGKFFLQHVKTATVAFAFGVVVLIATLVYGLHPVNSRYFFVYGGSLVLVSGSAVAIGWWAQRKIGGVTGDVLGFSIEFAHLLVILFVIVAHTAKYF